MAKKPPPGECVHCHNYFEKLNWDHVFPKAWYPDTTPNNMYKWQIPSCVRCNKLYGELEEDLLIRLAMAIDPDEPKSSGIVEKALRALDPSKGKSQKDKRLRKAKRDKILKESMVGENIPYQAVYPHFDDKYDQASEQRVAIPFKADHIKKLTQKIVRGLFYLNEGVVLKPPYSIETFVLTDESAAPMIELIEKFGIEYSRGPGIRVRRAVSHEDNTSSLFEIEIWGRLKMYAAVRDAKA